MTQVLAGIKVSFPATYRNAHYCKEERKVVVRVRQQCGEAIPIGGGWAWVYPDAKRFRWLPWEGITGFAVYLDPEWHLHGDIRVIDILDRICIENKNAFGEYRAQIYRAARGLVVTIHTSTR